MYLKKKRGLVSLKTKKVTVEEMPLVQISMICLSIYDSGFENKIGDDCKATISYQFKHSVHCCQFGRLPISLQTRSRKCQGTQR